MNSIKNAIETEAVFSDLMNDDTITTLLNNDFQNIINHYLSN